MTNSTETSTATVQHLEITRTLNAPRELVYKAWTEPERLAKWWGPKGFDIHVAELNLEPGGIFHYGMKMPDGQELWGIFKYGEINPPARLTFINSFADADKNIVRNPWSPTWPLEVMNILELEEKDGKTILTLRGGPLNATAEEIKTFEEGRPSMEQGFAGTFAQLEEYLEAITKQ